MSAPRAHAERSEASKRSIAAAPPLILRCAQDELASRAHLLDFTHALIEELLLIVVRDALAEKLLGALARELARVLGQLVARILQSIVDFGARLREDLLRFRFRGRDHLFLLALAFLLGALADVLDLILEQRKPGLNVVCDLIRLLPPRLRFFSGALNALMTLGERAGDRTFQEVAEQTDEEQHVRQLPDPRGKAEELRLFGVAAVLLVRMRDFVRSLLAAMRDVGRIRFRGVPPHRQAQEKKQKERAAHQISLPRICRAARRASDSASVTIRSRAAFTSSFSFASASSII